MHPLAATAAADHATFKGFDRPMCRVTVNVHVRAMVAVEAIHGNRVDTVVPHVGEVHRRAA